MNQTPNTNHLNLKQLTEVKKWDTKRVKAYKTRVVKHVSYLRSNMHTDDCFEIDTPCADEKKANLKKLDNYVGELKKILSTREHVE